MARPGRRPLEQTQGPLSKVARWRLKRGLTQAEAANASGMGLSTYWAYERRRVKDPSVISLMRIAYAFGCELTDLIDDDWTIERGVPGTGRDIWSPPPDPEKLWHPNRDE